MDKFDFKTLATRLSKHEADLVESYCKRKGITTSKFIKEILLKEINIGVPNNVAGHNIIEYKKERDSFSWSILLDNNEKTEIIEDMSPEYLENFDSVVEDALNQRNAIIGKKKNGSVAVPAAIMK